MVTADRGGLVCCRIVEWMGGREGQTGSDRNGWGPWPSAGANCWDGWRAFWEDAGAPDGEGSQGEWGVATVREVCIGLRVGH